MAAAIGQVGNGNFIGGGSCVTGSVNTSATGSDFYAVVFTSQGSVPTLAVSDNYSNSYTLIGSQLSSDNQYVNRYYCANGAGGTGHAFTSANASATFTVAVLIEMTGCALVSPLDQSAVGTQGAHTDPVSSGNITITPPASGEVMISACCANDGSNVTFTEANGFTIQYAYQIAATNNMQAAVGTKIVTSNGTYNASWSSGGGNLFWVTVIDSFLGASSTNSAPIAWVT